MIKKILVALDGSEHANRALNYALNLADKYSSTITLLSVIHQQYIPIDAEADLTLSIRINFLEEQRKQHEKLLSEALKRIKKEKPNLEISTKLMEGRPADMIVETAREGNFDIIVMGSRGIGGIKEIFLGSVSDRVSDNAHCPVLIVK